MWPGLKPNTFRVRRVGIIHIARYAKWTRCGVLKQNKFDAHLISVLFY